MQAQSILASVEHLKPWMPWAYDEPQSLENRIARLCQWRAKFDLDQEFVYGIFQPGRDARAGRRRPAPARGPLRLEIGYWVHEDFTGQGIATETSAALIKVGFEVLGLNRIEIHCDPRNLRSAAVPRKLGFTTKPPCPNASLIWIPSPIRWSGACSRQITPPARPHRPNSLPSTRPGEGCFNAFVPTISRKLVKYPFSARNALSMV